MKLKRIEKQKSVTKTKRTSKVDMEILAAAEHLKDLCAKNKRQLFTVFETQREESPRQIMWSFLSHNSPKNRKPNKEGRIDLIPEEVTGFFDGIALGVGVLSTGKYRVVHIPTSPTYEVGIAR